MRSMLHACGTFNEPDDDSRYKNNRNEGPALNILKGSFIYHCCSDLL